MKKVLIGIGAVLALLVAVALLAPVFVDLDDYKPEIARAVEQATGRRLAIDGSIDARLLPSPGASVSGVRFANAPGGSRPDMATLKSLEVDVALAPLLRGAVQVTSVTLVEPDILVEQLADGRTNLDFTGADSGAQGQAGAAGEGGGPPAVRLDRVRIQKGRIAYRDAATDRTWAAGNLDATLSAGSLQGPFAGVGELTVHDVPMAFAVSVGALDRTPIPASVELTLAPGEGSNGAAGAGRIVFRGSLSGAAADATLSGKLEVEAADTARFAAAAARLAGAPPPALAPALLSPAKLSAGVVGSARDLALNELRLTLGETVATGAVSAAFATPLQLDVALAVNKLDADALLAATGAAPGTPPAAPAPAATPAPAGGFALPDGLQATLNAEIDAIVFRGSIVRQAVLEAQLDKGALRVQRFAAQLPGGSDLSLAGTLAAENGRPRFQGRVEAASDNLRALAGWFGSDLAGVPADRLRKLSLTAGVNGTSEVVQIQNLDLRLDSSRITGAAAYALRSRPSFSLDLAVDRLNLDAYLPVAAQPAATQPAATPAARPAQPAGQPGAGGGLAALEGFDANVKLRADQLTVREQQVQGLRLDASLVGGTLTVREAVAQNAAGAGLALSGTANGFARAPQFATRFNANIGDPARFFRILDVTAPQALLRLGGLTASGTVSGTTGAATEVTGDVQVKAAAGLDGTLSGRFALPASGPASVDATLGLKAPDVQSVLRRIDPAAGSLKGPASLDAKLAGTLERMTVDVTLAAAQANASLRGTVAAAQAQPAYNLAVSLAHPQLTELLAVAGVDYRPAAANLGGLSLKSGVTGEGGRIALTDIDAAVGPVRVAGTASWDGSGPRPKFAADLRTSEILVDLFLPRAEGGAAGRQGSTAGSAAGSTGAAPRPGQRWSREPIDLSGLRGMDGTVQVAAQGVTWGAYAFAEPRIKLALANGVLDVDPLTGRLFDGAVQLAARVDATATPRLGLSIDLSGANLGTAVRQAAGLDTLTGTLDLKGQFTAAGASQHDLVSSLGGSAQFSGRDGIVKGIDLAALSERLKSLGEIGDYLVLLQTTMNGGETRYSRVGGTAQVQNGVIRSTDLRADLEAAEATAQAAVNLPAWQMDVKSVLRLTEHPQAPTIGVDLSGPIDQPVRDVRTRDLERYIAARAGASVLRKTLGKDNPLGTVLEGLTGGRSGAGSTAPAPATGGGTGAIPPPPPSSAPQQQQQQQNPTQQLLRGLGTILGGQKN